MKKRKTGILKVGVTGGIGSGKSTVCKAFERLGVPVLYADAIAKSISNTNPRVKTAITRLFGNSVYHSDGTLNREYVASRIFSEKNLQQRLNAIVHPLVERGLDRRIVELQEIGKKIVIVEAALIYEAGLDRKLDIVVVVDAEEDLRVDRLRLRDNVEEMEIRKRMKAQWNPEMKKKKADYVIYNNSSREELEKKVMFLHTMFQNL